MPRRWQQGKGIVVVDGKLVENLHVLNARRIVDLADAIAELEADHRGVAG